MSPSEREPIFHDRQFVIDQTPQTTSSLTFVDVTNAVLTTKDLAQTANYTVVFAFIISASVANTIATFTVNVNGVPMSQVPRTVSIKANNSDLGNTFLGVAETLEASDVIQAQWKTDKGILTMAEFNFLIDGIPVARIIP